VRKKIIIIKLQNYYALIITFNILQWNSVRFNFEVEW
jgi:hypothetical protein